MPSMVGVINAFKQANWAREYGRINVNENGKMPIKILNEIQIQI